VRISLRIATFVAALLSVFLGTRALLAQQYPPSSATRPAQTPTSQPHSRPQSGLSRTASPDVVVIDVGYIFKNHVRFNAMMEEMKKDLIEVEKQFRGETDRITKMAQEMSRFKPGSAEYNLEEEKITRARAQLQTEMALKKKEFMLREAKIYYHVYDEIVKVTADFCARYGISLVLRYNSEPIEAQNANSVMKGVNRNVVFQKSVNITYDILDMINPPRQQPTPQPGTPNPQVSRRSFNPPRN
jgi:Skp family chaperone for outer membrane proteins